MGKRPVTLCGCQVEVSATGRKVLDPATFFPQPFPAKLQPGDVLRYIVDPGPVDELVSREPPARGVAVVDAVGKEYRGPLRYSAEPCRDPDSNEET